MRTPSIYWFVNYSNDNQMRTTNMKCVSRLKDARRFAAGKYGYIVRQEWRNGQAYNALQEYFGGFTPSATEIARIDGIL